MADDLLDDFGVAVARAKSVITDAQGTTNIKAVDAHASGIAHALKRGRASLEGERIAILAAPGARFVAALIGIWKAHGTAVVLLPEHPEDEWRYALTDSGASQLLVSKEHEHASATTITAAMLIDDVPQKQGYLRSDAKGDVPALMLYTSGTTGKAKGAVLSRDNILVQARLLREAWGTTPDDTLLHALPLHHMHGLAIALINVLLAGASVTMMKFSAHDLWRNMNGATMFMAVPTMYAKLFAALGEASAETRAQYSEYASRLRLATSGSAALPVTLGEKFREISGQFPLERFGMTEIGVGLTNPLDQEERRAGHVGFPLPTVETHVTHDGELWIRGPSVFLRYHHKEEATRDAFTKADDGGAPWFRTGDTVTRDGASGPFKILGRTSQDILKSGGYKLSALEIEETLREHPAVAEVAVIGIPDETWGDRVVACVVRSAAHSDTSALTLSENLRAFAKEKLAFYKVPKDVEFMPDLPRNALGKVQKHILKAALSSDPKNKP